MWPSSLRPIAWGYRAVSAATTTIPVVFTTGVDPIEAGLVTSLNRPSGNVTGLTAMNSQLGAKQLELLHELIPEATRFAVLVEPPSAYTASILADLRAAASSLGRQIEALHASTIGDIDAAFASLMQKRADALLVTPSVLFFNRRVQLLTLAARHAVPAIYWTCDFTETSGLMSYGSDVTDQLRQAGIFTGRILKGAKPTDLPVLQPTKFELVINLKTAKTLGLTIPPGCSPRRRGDRVKRREFITLLGGAATWPLAARAQQAAMPVIGFLSLGSPNPKSAFEDRIPTRTRRCRLFPGQNVAIEFRLANNQPSSCHGLPPIWWIVRWL